MSGPTRLPWRPLFARYPKSSSRSLSRPVSLYSKLPFAYKPLRTNEIRVLDLYPGHSTDPVRCRLRTVALSDRSPFETLSYCWGLNKHEEEIDCDGGVVPVTKNLYKALQHLRNGEQSRALWIDAVCIDQPNMEERGQQVSMMKDIFQLSERTIVWLGHEARDTKVAFDLARQLAAISQNPASSGWRSHVSTRIPPLYAPAWKAFAAILQRPWWHRAWVVQEAAVAQDILVACGKQSIPWNDLVQAIQYAVDLGVFIAYGGSTAYQALRLFETRSNFQGHHLLPLHQILLRSRSFLATDARDKVFGLLALANPENVKAMNLKPNYHLGVDELYQQVTMSLLQQPDLSAFSASGVHQKSAERSLPSWVSDWSASDPSVPLTTPRAGVYEDRSSFYPAASDYNASSSTTSSPIFDHDKNLLGLEGVLVDQVEAIGRLSRTRYLRHVSHMFELFVQCHDILEQLKDWEQIARVGYWQRNQRYPTGIKHRDAYWQTLCVGRVPLNLRSAKHDPRYKYYVIIRSLRTLVRRTIRWFPRSNKDTWYNRLFYSMFQNAWRVLGLTPAKIQRIGFPPENQISNYRRMIRTEKGYIALVPGSTNIGDWIAVCRGGKVPLVVRKEGEHWVLVGETYMHGIMNGEAWDEKAAKLMWFK